MQQCLGRWLSEDFISIVRHSPLTNLSTAVQVEKLAKAMHYKHLHHLQNWTEYIWANRIADMIGVTNSSTFNLAFFWFLK